MSRLLDLTFYNPAQLKDDDFLKGFVVRRELVEKILARLAEIKPRGMARHRLILGQRGMGKTSLLRRIALGVRETPALAATLLPLSFREEQYNVHNLHVFWCNCLDALGDWFEAGGQRQQAEQVDRDVAAIDGRADDDEGSIALGVFREWMRREKKRPLLLLDNIDLIFDGLKDKQWSLRRVLQEGGGVVVIGSAAGFLEATAKRDAAFYDFFQIDVLEKLGQEETLSCLRQLAAKRGEPGRKVIHLLDEDPARIHVLHDLTGGNPRTLTMLYLMLEMSDDSDLMRDLERLLDQATPLYKARVEELAPQTRVTFDAVALAWNPTTAADVATATGLEIGIVSSQLDRLNKNGLIEKAPLSSSTRTGFQLAERFFNIWYLMRHAPRRQRSQLRWLVEFLRNFYTPRQLDELAIGLIGRAGIDRLTRGMYCLALSDAIDDTALRDTLRFEAKQEIERYAEEKGVPTESLANTAELYSPKSVKEWLVYGNVLDDHVHDTLRAEAAYRKAIELDPKDARPWIILGFLLADKVGRYEEAEAAYRKAIELDSKDAWPWNSLGNLLADKLGRREEAEQAYRQALKIDAEAVCPAVNLAYLLLGRQEHGVEAESFYQQAIAVLSPHGAGLLRAYHGLVDDNFGAAVSELKRVLEEGHAELFSSFRDDLLRVLRLAATRGYGERMLTWLDESGLKDRYWPLHAAFDAHLHGEDRLQDVNPEVRGAASRILSWLARGSKETPTTPPAKPKLGRRGSRRNSL